MFVMSARDLVLTWRDTIRSRGASNAALNSIALKHITVTALGV